jgi:hypothetical protein
LLADGNVKCWGYNSNGQLGYGDTVTKNNAGLVVNVQTKCVPPQMTNTCKASYMPTKIKTNHMVLDPLKENLRENIFITHG